MYSASVHHVAVNKLENKINNHRFFSQVCISQVFFFTGFSQVVTM